MADIFDSFRGDFDIIWINPARKVHKVMKIGSKEWEENSEYVQKRSYEPNDDGRYQTANKEEKEKLINLGNLVPIFFIID